MCQNDCERKFQNALDNTDRKRVADQSSCIVALEERFEIIKTNPRASPDSLLKGIILKCQNGTSHRHIADQCVVDDTWKQHDIQRPVPHQSYSD